MVDYPSTLSPFGASVLYSSIRVASRPGNQENPGMFGNKIVVRETSGKKNTD